MIYRWVVLLTCLLVAVSCVGFCDNAPMGRYNAQQNGYTAEKLEPPLILNWEFTGSKYHANTAAPVVSDGVCYFAGGDRVYAVDAESGNVKWKYPQDQSLTSVVKATPEIQDGKLYFGCADGRLYCLDAQTGSFQWLFETRGSLRCPPITIDSTMYLGSDDHSIYTIDAASGEMGWKPFVARDDFAVGIAAGAGMVVGSCMDGNVYGVNASSGKLRWIFRLAGAPVKTSPVMTENQTIMAVGNVVYGLTTRSGQKKWMIQLPAEAAASPASDGTSIYIACHDKKLYCYNVSGRVPALRWTAPGEILGTPLSSPTVAGGMVYVTTTHGIVSAFSTGDGVLKWRYTFLPSSTSGAATTDASCSPVVANGSLYVLTDDGVLHCFTKTAADTTPPEIYSVQPANGTRMSGLPPIDFSAKIFDIGSGADIGNGDNPGSATMLLDDSPVQLTSDPLTGTVSYTYDVADAKATLKALSNGVHTVSLTVKDYAGNQITKQWTFTADSSMPAPKRTSKSSVGKSTSETGIVTTKRTKNNSTTQDQAPPPPGGWGNPNDQSGNNGGGYRGRGRGGYGRRGGGGYNGPMPGN